MERLTKWEGIDEDGRKRAVFTNRTPLFDDMLQPALRKLALYEDAEEKGLLRLPSDAEVKLSMKIAELQKLRQVEMAETIKLKRVIEIMHEKLQKL